MTSQQRPTRRHAITVCVAAGITAVVCGALLTLAVLLSAPPVALPFVIAICVGCPALAAWELSASLPVLRRRRDDGAALDASAVDELRRYLDALPETRHPLGL